jgi:hypothetical protein
VKIVLLRVGADTGHGSGGILGPIFRDGTFEYIPIPDAGGPDSRTYGSLIGRHGKPLVEYFPERRRSVMAGTSVHVDPEFDEYTYGDPTGLKKRLAELASGDMLVFYAGLRSIDHEANDALYIIGYFEVVAAGLAESFTSEELRRLFGTNAHVRHPEIFDEQKDRLVLVKGGAGSRLLERAVCISSVGIDRRGKPVHVLDSQFMPIFGGFTELNAIQRCAPRWVRPEHTARAAEFVRSLK